MKMLLFGVILLLGCLNGFPQGTVIFNNRAVGSVVSHVYLARPDVSWIGQVGNGPNDYPAGTTDWNYWPLVSGAGYSAQLFAARGENAPEYLLIPAFPITTFRTGVAAGFVVGATATLPGVPADFPAATLQMRVWDNRGGTVDSWSDALNFSVRRGSSPTFNVYDIGGTFNPAPTLDGLVSFNIGTTAPEPSTLVLFAIAAALVLVRRCYR